MEKTDEQKSTTLSTKLAKQKDTKKSRQAFKIAFKKLKNFNFLSYIADIMHVVCVPIVSN